MSTITVDIYNQNALNLLLDLERMNFIKLRTEGQDKMSFANAGIMKLQGRMSQHAIEDVDLQIKKMREEWR